MPNANVVSFSWEMSTIGHPLSDIVNLTAPFLFAVGGPEPQRHPGFIEGATPGLPTKDEIIEWYAEVAGWNPAPDLAWGEAFGTFRNSCIVQGIAARYAARQASSARAKDHAGQMKPFGEFAYFLVEKARAAAGDKAKL